MNRSSSTCLSNQASAFNVVGTCSTTAVEELGSLDRLASGVLRHDDRHHLRRFLSHSRVQDRIHPGIGRVKNRNPPKKTVRLSTR
jgi:hypothetical protein